MTNLLVVDDSELDRRFAASLLEQTDFRVTFAENGAKALVIIQNDPPDLVLTDLQMPQMDGLELVTNARMQAPDIPIVLMTAHGSETVAAEALQRGAACYVPKSELADKLVSTLSEISALLRADRSYGRLVDCSTKTEFDFSLPNDPSLIDPLVDLMQQMLRSMSLCDANGEIQIGVALEQAIQNAMVHGNLELTGEDLREASNADKLIADRQAQAPFGDRTVKVGLKISRVMAEFTVENEGTGFDHTVADEPTTDSGAASGRGLVLMSTFMDSVEFSNKGRTVRMVKHRADT